MRYALGRQSTPDGQARYRADFSFTNAEMEHAMQKVMRHQYASVDPDNESIMSDSSEPRNSAASADERSASSADGRNASSAIQKGLTVMQARPGEVTLTQRRSVRMVVVEPDNYDEAIKVSERWWVCDKREDRVDGRTFELLERVSKRLGYKLRHDPEVHLDRDAAVPIAEAL